MEDIEDYEVHKKEILPKTNKGKNAKSNRQMKANDRDIYRNRFFDEEVDLNQVASMLKKEDMTEEQLIKQNNLLKQKYTEKG
jgi:hypothetical protein